MRNKILSKNIALNYLREKRKYLHSTDIFEKILFLRKKNLFKNLKIFFKKPIFNETEIIFQNSFSETLKKKCSSYFEYVINKEIFFGYIIPKKIKLKKTKPYKELEIQKNIKIIKNQVFVPNLKKFNFIELITASAMKFLKKKSPEKKTKWYLAKLDIKSFSYKKLRFNKFLTLKKNSLNPTIYNFEVFQKTKKIGNILFIKK